MRRARNPASTATGPYPHGPMTQPSQRVRRFAARLRPGRRTARVSARLAAIAGLAALPFWLLVRASLHLHSGLGWNPWLAVSGAFLLTSGLLTLYLGWIWRRLTGRARLKALATRAVLPALSLLCAYSLLYLSERQAKSHEVRGGYTQLHPSLRLAVGLYRILDGDVVYTDFRRERDAYAGMGLPAPRRSLHFEQPDGFVYALDMRTHGRGALRNWLAQGYFEILGFDTLRHHGSADHLHVAVPLVPDEAGQALTSFRGPADEGGELAGGTSWAGFSASSRF